MKDVDTTNPREAAYYAVLAYLSGDIFIAETLRQWQYRCHPSAIDFRFAQEIAYGSVRKMLTLDYIAKRGASKGVLRLKAKEKALLFTALYQMFDMERVPSYAIVDETVKLSTKYCHPSFVKFLNALLRTLTTNKPKLPEDSTIESLSIRYSYPKFFVQSLIEDYDLKTAENIMLAGNTPGITMARLRSNTTIDSLPQGMELLTDAPIPIAIVTDTTLIPQLASTSTIYLQNVTPATLIGMLAQHITSPESILDLCASPGGKIIAIHDLFPETHLFANDVSENKVQRLRQNLAKYHIDASVTCCPGQLLNPKRLFDIVIIDAPCSNSGTLNKRPEARWRITKESLTQLNELQLDLLQQGKKMLKPQGQLWYMTCSILKNENEKIINKACQKFGFKSVYQNFVILPNNKGWDGGFAQALKTS